MKGMRVKEGRREKGNKRGIQNEANDVARYKGARAGMLVGRIVGV